jgi:plasmid stability protein
MLADHHDAQHDAYVSVQAVTVNLPSSLYERLVQRASRTRRTVEAELVEAVTTSLPDEPDELPADMAEAIAALHLLDDEALWRAAGTRLAPEKAADIEDLHLKRQREGLSASEAEALAAWMKEYTRIMLVRARAAALLKQRGHDVSALLPEHGP